MKKGPTSNCLYDDLKADFRPWEKNHLFSSHQVLIFRIKCLIKVILFSNLGEVIINISCANDKGNERLRSKRVQKNLHSSPSLILIQSRRWPEFRCS